MVLKIEFGENKKVFWFNNHKIMNDISPYKILWESLNYTSSYNGQDLIDKASTLITACSKDFGPTTGMVINTQDSSFIWGGGKFEDVFSMKMRTFMSLVDFNTYFNFYPKQDFEFNVRCYTAFWNLYIKNNSATEIEYYWEVRLKIDAELKWCRVRMVLSSLDGNDGFLFPIGLITNITELKLDNYLTFYAFDKAKQKLLIKNKEWAYPQNMELLTTREQEIILMVAEGFPAKQIADKLCIAENTIKVHKQRIFKKLDVKNSIEMMRVVCKQKLIDWP